MLAPAPQRALFDSVLRRVIVTCARSLRIPPLNTVGRRSNNVRRPRSNRRSRAISTAAAAQQLPISEGAGNTGRLQMSMTASGVTTEQFAGTGDVIDAGGHRIARIPYRARVVYPGRGTQGTVGRVSLSLDLSPEEAAFLRAAGRLTMRFEDGREVDFLIAAIQNFSGFVEVLTLTRIQQRLRHAAISYVRDDARRRIRIALGQLLPADDLLAMVERQLREGAWTYATIYDLRAIQGAPSRTDAIASARRVGRLIELHGPRGPVAIVTQSIDMIRAAHAYAFDSALGGHPVEVFSDIDDAEYWVAYRLGDGPNDVLGYATPGDGS